MCNVRAHIALEAREDLQFFEQRESHDNLRSLESHGCDKEIKDLWGFEKREDTWRHPSPADCHKDLEDYKNCIEGLMTLRGPWKWSPSPPGAQSWRGWLGSSAWWNSPHKSHTWVAKDFRDKKYLIWQRPTCLCFLILTLSFNLLLHLIPVFLMITSHLAACVSWYNLPKWSGERSKPRLTNTAGTLEGNMLQRKHKERLAAYQIIVADAADAVSVNFSGRCKFLQI